jgi:tyrosine-protein phosphatase SIW14
MKTLVCALLTTCVSVRAEISPKLHLHEVDANLYRGRQPNEADFADLKQIGIKSVLDLRGGMFHKPWERKRVAAAGMQYFSVRLSGIWPPKNDQVAKILALLEDPAHEPFYVHCRRGYDRVGMVIAAYRIAHDHWSNKQALAEADKDGINRFELLMKLWIKKFDPSKLNVPSQTTAGAAPEGH